MQKFVALFFIGLAVTRLHTAERTRRVWVVYTECRNFLLCKLECQKIPRVKIGMSADKYRTSDVSPPVTYSLVVDMMSTVLDGK